MTLVIINVAKKVFVSLQPMKQPDSHSSGKYLVQSSSEITGCLDFRPGKRNWASKSVKAIIHRCVNHQFFTSLEGVSVKQQQFMDFKNPSAMLTGKTFVH